jgi:hypothetical protein
MYHISRRENFCVKIVRFIVEKIPLFLPDSSLAFVVEALIRIHWMREWYGAFLIFGQQAQDSAEKIKRDQLNVSTVYSVLFPPRGLNLCHIWPVVSVSS